MKIRIKSIMDNDKEKYIYEISDDKGNTIDINVAYLETAIKILNVADQKMTVRNAKAFEKFIINIKRATRYYDKMEKKVIETPNIMHSNIDNEELANYHAKYIKYDKKSQALFSLHNGWYENFISIIEEIKQIIKEYSDLEKDDNKELLYVAVRIDGILDKYRKKQKVKAL